MNTTYKLARLSDASDDLTKAWVVVYYVWSVRYQRQVRKRGVINGDTIEDRKEQAKAVIRKINKALKAGMVTHVPPPPKEPAPLEAEVITNVLSAVDHFLKVKKQSLKGSSHKTYRSSMNLFKSFLKVRRLELARLTDFTTEHAWAYMDYILLDKKLANKSYNKHLGTVETMFNMYLDRKKIKENPFIQVKTLPERPGKHTAFSMEQIGKIREVCSLSGDKQLWLFLNFLYFTFARPGSELRLLKVGDILEKTIRINPDDAKNNRIGYVQIPPPLERLIEEHQLRSYPAGHCVFTAEGVPGEKPTYEKYFYNRHRAILTLLKFEGQYDLYGWKHTGVIALYTATKDVKLIQRQCRHQSLDQTDKYLRDLGLFTMDRQFDNLAGI